jgi:hypothetical protein
MQFFIDFDQSEKFFNQSASSCDQSASRLVKRHFDRVKSHFDPVKSCFYPEFAGSIGSKGILIRIFSILIGLNDKMIWFLPF